MPTRFLAPFLSLCLIAGCALGSPDPATPAAPIPPRAASFEVVDAQKYDAAKLGARLGEQS